jgi:PAS domain S-box-containing protein
MKKLIFEEHYPKNLNLGRVDECKKREEIFINPPKDLISSNRSLEKFKPLEIHEEILKHVTNGIVIYEITDDKKDFIIKYVNNVFADVINIQRDNILGVKLTQIIPELKETSLFKLLKDVYETGDLKRMDMYYFDGKKLIYGAENHFSCLPSGRILDVQHKITDFQKLKGIYDNLINNTFQGLLIYQNRHVVVANERLSQITGYSLDEIYNCEFDLDQLFLNEADNLRQLLIDLSDGTEISKHQEVRFKHKNGTLKWVRIYATSIIYNDTSSIQIVVIDITKLKMAEKESKLKEKELMEIQSLSKTASFKHDLITDKVTGVPELYTITGFNPKYPLYLDSFYRIIHPDDLKEFKENVQNSFNKDLNGLNRIITPQGHEKYLKFQTTPRYSEDGTPLKVIGYLQDITELKRYENDLIASLTEKNILIKEIQHRVRNNLQLIMSLLNLQSHYKEYNGEEIIRNTKSKIRAMALTHEDAYNAPDLKQDIPQYINKLIRYILRLHNIDTNRVIVDTDVDDMKLGIDTVIPLGLIINEIITNSVQYAFPEETSGKINLSLKRTRDNLILKISDTGIGIPETINIENPETLGLTIINSLTTQLDGTLEITKTLGTNYKILFKEQYYRKRT